MQSTSGKLRVCVYRRTCYDVDNKELWSKYLQMAAAHPDWKLEAIFTDTGASGSSMKHRLALQDMLYACRRGEYDLIVTKNPAQLSRDFQDYLSIMRELKALKPPVDVFFEKDDQNAQKVTDLLLSFLPEQ